MTKISPFRDDGGYRTCEYCYETCCEDIWSGREWRQFYRTADDDSGIDVCEHCVQKHNEFPETA